MLLSGGTNREWLGCAATVVGFDQVDQPKRSDRMGEQFAVSWDENHPVWKSPSLRTEATLGQLQVESAPISI